MSDNNSRFSLPYLAQVFEALRKGQHLSPQDKELYAALANNFSDFQLLFKELGFQLFEHLRGFYYFKGVGALSDKATKLSVFMFILIEHLAGQGFDIEEGLMTHIFSVEALPHESTARYSGYMKEAGAGVMSCIKGLAVLGFLQLAKDEKTFQFRLPVYRFVDVCLEILQTEDINRQDEQVAGSPA
ncbi:MAG: condensin complex protein MksE [Rhodocyclaceae bacterium]